MLVFWCPAMTDTKTPDYRPLPARELDRLLAEAHGTCPDHPRPNERVWVFVDRVCTVLVLVCLAFAALGGL